VAAFAVAAIVEERAVNGQALVHGEVH
jgi:hypothetical protein